MFDGFDANGTFYTDSNGWAMEKRDIEGNKSKPAFVPRNYFPVDSAIIMKDNNLHKRVTIMNDRP